VTPTVQDVRGAPVAGLPTVAPAATGSPIVNEFERILERLRSVVPAHKAKPQPPTLPAPARVLRQPGRTGPRLGLHGAAPVRQVPAKGAKRTTPTSPTPAKHALAASIRQAAAHAGVAPALSVAVARAESSLDPRARSADGKSVGTFQVLPSTAAEMRRKIAAGTVARPPGSDDVALGVGYLRYLHDLFGRNAQLGRNLHTVAVADRGERERFAVAAFNAGEGTVARAQAKAAAAGHDPTRFADVRPFLPVQTRTYVERVVAFAREDQADETTLV